MNKFHLVSSNTVNNLNQKYYLDYRLPSHGTCMIPEQFPDPVTTETTPNSLKSTANSYLFSAELGFHPQLDRHLTLTSAQRNCCSGHSIICGYHHGNLITHQIQQSRNIQLAPVEVEGYPHKQLGFIEILKASRTNAAKGKKPNSMISWIYYMPIF